MEYKESTNAQLLALYNRSDLDNVIKVGRAMLESSLHKDNKYFMAHLHGEICETVLECIIIDYIKRYGLKKQGWFYKKGLILRDVNNVKSGYFTELDLTVFTPQKIFAFECKSYGGDKKIVDKCTIKKKKGGTPFDVYDQHSKHFKVLADQLQPFRIINKNTRGFAPYQLILFDFATGTTKDVREDRDKMVMPCLNESNVENIFKLVEGKPIMWDINFVRKAVDIIDKKSEENRKKHLEYVKSLHPGN
jgi:hypothetical protein